MSMKPQIVPTKGQASHRKPLTRKSVMRTQYVVPAIITAFTSVLITLIVLYRPFLSPPSDRESPAQTRANAPASAAAASPSVQITSPTDGSTVDLITLVQGTTSNIPNGEELWVIVVPDGISAYYPQLGPVVITGNTWSASATVGDTSSHSQGRGFTLIIAIANQSGSAAIRAYLDHSKQTGSYPGMPSLPDGVLLQNQIHVTRS